MGTHRDIVEQTEAAGEIAFRMVTRRPHQGGGVFRLPARHQPEPCNHRAGGKAGRIVRAGRGVGIRIENGKLAAGGLGNAIDMRLAVVHGQFGKARRRKFRKKKTLLVFRLVQLLINDGKTLRTFHMVKAGIVFEKEPVFQDRSFSAHGLLPPIWMVLVSVTRACRRWSCGARGTRATTCRSKARPMRRACGASPLKKRS